jgi:hypothetical protein
MRNTAIQVSELQPDEPHMKSPFNRPSPAIVKLHPYMQGINFEHISQFYLLDPSLWPYQTPFLPDICRIKVQTPGSQEHNTSMDLGIPVCLFTS